MATDQGLDLSISDERNNQAARASSLGSPVVVAQERS